MDWAQAFAVDAALAKFTVKHSLFLERHFGAHQAHDVFLFAVIVITY